MTPTPAPPRRTRTRSRLHKDDVGQITPWTIIATLIVIVLAGLVYDAGMAMADKVRAYDLAQAAARAGAQHLDLATYRTTGALRLDAGTAAAAARTFLTQAGVSGTATATGDTVTVTVHTVHRTALLQLVGVAGIPMTAAATATPATGVTTAG